jgi:hypothetical protein
VYVNTENTDYMNQNFSAKGWIDGAWLNFEFMLVVSFIFRQLFEFIII